MSETSARPQPSSLFDSELPLYVELKPNLECVYCILKISQFSQIDIQNSCVSLLNGEDSVTWDLRPLKHEFRVNTCNGLNKKSATEIHFRMQTSPTKDQHKQINNDRRIHFNDHDGIACGQCHQDFLVIGCYDRVLPLPSEGWADMADNWFCHQHDNGEQKEKYALVPREKDLLYGDHYLMVRVDNDLTGLLVQGDDVVCVRCKSHVGEVHHADRQVCKMYYHMMSFLDNNAEGVQYSSIVILECLFASIIMEQNTKTLCYKFILEYKEYGNVKPFALVWLMESEIQLALGNSEGFIEVNDVVKLLYLPCFTANGEEVKEWQQDNKVHSIVLPYSACVQIVDILQHSTQKLPCSLMKAGKLFVGFLKTH